MREIKEQEWGAFCERLNQFEKGGTMTIQVIDRNGGTREIARTVSFEEIHYGRKDACNDEMVVRSRGNENVKHEIVEPIHVLLRETEGGAAFNSVMIEAESGTTVLTFQPVIRAAWLEGLQTR